MDRHDFSQKFSHPNIKNIIDQFTSTSIQHGKQISEMSRILEKMSTSNVTKLYLQSDVLKQLQTIQSAFDSRISRIIDNTSSLAGINSKLLDNTSSLTGISSKFIDNTSALAGINSKLLDDTLSSLSRGVRISELAKSSLRHQLQVSELAKSSLRHQLQVSELAKSSLRHQLQVSEALQSLQSFKDLFSTFSHFSTSYSDLTTSAEKIILEKPNSARVVSELSALEVLNNVDVLEAVSTSEAEIENKIDNKNLEVEIDNQVGNEELIDNKELELEIDNQVDNKELEQEKQSIKNEVFKEIEQIETLLINIGSPDLVPMWQGAKAALNSTDNPDYARHCTVSLRELFTQVIHRLSPDNEIKNWSGINDNKDFFHNGKPTRRARLLYICRSVNHDIFSDFINKDVEAVLAIVKLFQRGTHQATIPFTHKQLIALQVRIESTINFLIETSLLNE